MSSSITVVHNGQQYDGQHQEKLRLSNGLDKVEASTGIEPVYTDLQSAA